MAELLVKKGADINSTCAIYGQTPLHFAVMGGRIDTD
ncbi:MAG TPA: hypothetical protein DET40_09095 [Lentisphaeria bacterium]|nr:hypothetical protein [Lentisphaeria bacterium]